MVALLNGRLPPEMHSCTVPALPAGKVLSYANTPGSPLHAALRACRLAPLPTDRNLVFGAIAPSLQSLSTRDLAGLPALRSFKSAFAPSVSMCAGLIPCNGNLFLGIEGMERSVRMQGSYFSLDYKLSQMQYSQGAAGVPPAWRRADGVGGLPTFWQMDRPDLPATVGHPTPMAILATPWGRVFLGGALRAGSISLVGAQLNLGPQANAWSLWRDATQPALSLRLANAPDINLWGQLALPFRGLPALRQVDILVKPQTGQWWLTTTAQRQAVPARNLAAVVRPIGAVLERLFVGLYQSAAEVNVLIALDVAGSTQGASLRLRFAAGFWALAPEAAAAVGASAIVDEFALILRANQGASSFAKVTLEVGGRAFPMPYALQ
ncbi:T9SS C-terminal target domain-containing [Chlorella sorokiniana]|uniref:T9SS C-terminal target domain-containing n=1 Tax=Chlorella sorokiniana TaxID=3076 RepID=A0A2P6U4N3_CHLSO|nr:T9SS C-terminal target domain-containing [Chlorella sorokiniana]|eukprot:PRW61278.1 T9SS C-terminal target domain-containing [Chlorella sorokiniana]